MTKCYAKQCETDFEDILADLHRERKEYDAFIAGVEAAFAHDGTFENCDEFADWVRDEYADWRGDRR